ncbi:Gfo/Idh/MocA family oxidoreductase [bacterium]|nr:Gfo/Idh/MocA family oxidoreductase [bacterium]
MGNSNKVRVGIIGAGGISQVSHIPNIISEPSAELVALCDTDAGRVAAVAERFGISTWYDQPEDMLKREKLDGIILTTPTITHLPLAQMILESGIDLMVEKPLARNVNEAKKIVETAEKTGRVLLVAMNHRFREDTDHLKNLIQEGELGEIQMVRAGWLRRLGVWGRPYWFTDPKLAGGGVLMDLGLQMIDLVFYLLGFPAVVETVGSASNATLELEVEDTASAFIRLSDETSFTLGVSWANCSREDIAYTYISGSKGAASLNPLRLTRRRGNRVIETTPPGLEDISELYRESYRFEVAHFIDCIEGESKPLATGREAIATLEVLEKLYQSADK